VSRLTDLIAQAKAKDSQLGEDLDKERTNADSFNFRNTNRVKAFHIPWP